MSNSISPSEVSAHNSVNTGLYVIIDSNVYDMTGFVDEHPGGAKILKRVGGKDASKQFWKESSLFLGPLRDDLSQYHNEGVLKKYEGRLKIGHVEEKAKL